MGRGKGTSNVNADEIAHIRALYGQGMRIAEITTATGRSESVVYRATRNLERKRPPPPSGRHSLRNDLVLRLLEEGLTRERIGDIVGLRPSQLGKVIATHPHVIWLLRVRKLKPATVASRYRMELSTAERIAKQATTKDVPRTRERPW